MRTLVRNADALGRPVAVATRYELAANGADEDLREYFAIANEVPRIVQDFDALCETQQIYQLMLGCRKKDYPAVLQGAHGAKIAAWWDRAVDVIPAGGGKGIGIQKTLAYFGLTPAQAAAFGDGNNDCEMLDAVGMGVAMGNASPELKARADAQIDVKGQMQHDLAEIRLKQNADDGVDDVLGQGGDQRTERTADQNTDCHIHHIAF